MTRLSSTDCVRVDTTGATPPDEIDPDWTKHLIDFVHRRGVALDTTTDSLRSLRSPRMALSGYTILRRIRQHRTDPRVLALPHAGHQTSHNYDPLPSTVLGLAASVPSPHIARALNLLDMAQKLRNPKALRAVARQHALRIADGPWSTIWIPLDDIHRRRQTGSGNVKEGRQHCLTRNGVLVFRPAIIFDPLVTAGMDLAYPVDYDDTTGVTP